MGRKKLAGVKIKKKYSPKSSVRGSKQWSNRELLSLAKALQLYGFAETQKIAEAIKTKDANEVQCFIKTRIRESRARYFNRKCTNKPCNTWHIRGLGDIKTCPAVQKWRKMACNQMYPHIRSQDFSRPAILALCQKFYDEAAEPKNPQLVNLKLIYKYILDCMRNEVPAQLPPKESAVVLIILKQLKEMLNKFDFKEEINFIKNFKKSTTFVPFHIKDEFKKKSQSSPTTDCKTKDSDAVRIPHDLYANFSRHKRVVQSFNPLMVPVWLLGKEQEFMAEIFKKSGS